MNRVETHAGSVSGQPPVRQAAESIDLSIVIVAYKSPDIVLHAVRSLLDHSGRLRLEIIVVDNASGDDSAERFKAAFPEITVLKSSFNGGYAWGNDVGLARARGRHVLVLNPDTEASEGALETAVSYLDENPDVGMVGARSATGDGDYERTRFRFPTLRLLAWRLLLPERLLEDSTRFGDQSYWGTPIDEIVDVETVLGSFMMVPRRVIDRVGPMDHRFFLYSEESEWCWRIWQAGYKVRYHPDVRITHFGAGTTGGTNPFVLVELSRGQILFFRFTRGPFQAWVATLLMLLSSLSRTIWIPSYRGTTGPELRKAWRKRAGFLFRALVRQPSGQSAPSPDTAEAEGVVVECGLAGAAEDNYGRNDERGGEKTTNV